MRTTKFRWGVPSLVMAVASTYLIVANGGIHSAPRFADEAAILGQTYFFRLVMDRDFSNPDWLSHAAYDHQPLYKYMIGASLYLTGQYDAVPKSLSDWKKWMYVGTYDPQPGRALDTARITMALGAGFACAAAFCLGRAFGGTSAGLLAAVLFASSPLVFVYGRRAMIDVTTQGLVMASLAAFAGMGRRQGLGFFAWMAVAAVLAGTAYLSKWNAIVALFAVSNFAILCLLFASNRARVAGIFCFIGVQAGLLVNIGGDPYLWAMPTRSIVRSETSKELNAIIDQSMMGRLLHATQYRRATLQGASQQFPNDYLTPVERFPAIVIQGLGRWSLGNRLYSIEEANLPRSQRTRWTDKLRAGILGVLVLAGLWSLISEGMHQRMNDTPVSWLIPLWMAVDLLFLLGNLTLDWDRYYMSTVAQGSVLSSLGLAAMGRGLVHALKLPANNLQEI